jgi:hypothetical protein
MHAALLAGCQQSFHNSPRQIFWTGGESSSPVFISESGIVALHWMESGRSTLGIVDTGATGLIVSREFARDRHLPITYDPMGIAADATGSRHHGLQVAHLDRFELPGVVLYDLDAPVVDFTELRRASDPHLDIILGRAAFDQMTLTIDYPGRRIKLDSTPLPPPDGKTILPLKPSDRQEWMAPVTFDGKQIWLILDTGWCCYDLALGHKAQGELGVSPESSEAVQTTTPLGGQVLKKSGILKKNIYLGNHRIPAPLSVFILPNDGPDLLASGILRRFVLTIDPRNLRSRFTLPAKSDIGQKFQ